MPPVKLVDGGELRRDVWELILANSRTPELIRGDMGAQLSAVRVAARRVEELFAKHGSGTVMAASVEWLDRAERLMLAQIAAMPDGQYFGESVIEDDGYGSGDEHIGCRIVVAGNHMAIRMESPPQSANYRNSYWGNTLGAIYLGVLTALDPDFRSTKDSIDLWTSTSSEWHTPERRASRRVRRQHLESLGGRHARRSATRSARSCRTCQRRVGSCRMQLGVGIDPRDGAPYGGLIITFTGGSGAVYGHDGALSWRSDGRRRRWSATSRCSNSDRGVLISRHELTRDSAMPGRWRGAPGAVLELEIVGRRATVTHYGDGVKIPTSEPARRCIAGQSGVAGSRQATRPPRWNPGSSSAPFCDRGGRQEIGSSPSFRVAAASGLPGSETDLRSRVTSAKAM